MSCARFGSVSQNTTLNGVRDPRRFRLVTGPSVPRLRPNTFAPRCLTTMPTLDSFSEGQSGVIRDIVGEDGIAVRLMEMGLIEGQPVTVLGFAPLGDPIEIEIRGYRLSLRKSEAQRVEMETTP